MPSVLVCVARYYVSLGKNIEGDAKQKFENFKQAVKYLREVYDAAVDAAVDPDTDSTVRQAYEDLLYHKRLWVFSVCDC